jgi:hypothetical protein
VRWPFRLFVPTLSLRIKDRVRPLSSCSRCSCQLTLPQAPDLTVWQCYRMDAMKNVQQPQCLLSLASAFGVCAMATFDPQIATLPTALHIGQLRRCRRGGGKRASHRQSMHTWRSLMREYEFGVHDGEATGTEPTEGWESLRGTSLDLGYASFRNSAQVGQSIRPRCGARRRGGAAA